MLISRFQLLPEQGHSLVLLSQPLLFDLGDFLQNWALNVDCLVQVSLLNKIEKESVAVSILVTSSGLVFANFLLWIAKCFLRK